ncbi:hypothetical protein SVAN01_10049 [Stagonosporopsis vannaccii]|nr:hypothetical protein SVAN01_10049 [Stagonosporopsis vannaccii]
MPNVGRPSKGCKRCRDRKVKCDQKRPSCSQCIRTGQECYGYRDALSMMFKDETAVVAKKAKTKYRASTTQSPQSGAEHRERQHSEPNGSKASFNLHAEANAQSLEPIDPRTSTWPTAGSVVREITPSIEDQAMGLFISSHVSQPAPIARGQYEWVLEALHRPGCEEIVRSSVNAASLAALANSTKNAVIAAKAYAAYGSALQMTNSALCVKETAVKDSTLISVILLGLYENFVFHDERSIQAWAKHVQGASALINLRGKEQFQSSTARRIFRQFYCIVLLVCLESGTPVPSGLRDLYGYCNLGSDYDIQGRQWRIRLSRFMHDAIDLNRDKDSDPITVVTKAISIDRELDSIKAHLPRTWHYDTVRLQQPSKYAHGSFYHVYADPWIAQMWNNLRLCRMHLYRVIREQLWKARACVPPLFSREEVEPQIAAAQAVIQTITASMCASVPQLTGMVTFSDYSTGGPSGLSAGSNAEAAGPNAARHQVHPPGTFLDPAKPTGMHHLIWPLYAAGSSDLSSNEMRQYAIDMLYFIALRIGTRQAVVLADHLKEMQQSGPQEFRRQP